MAAKKINLLKPIGYKDWKALELLKNSMLGGLIYHTHTKLKAPWPKWKNDRISSKHLVLSCPRIQTAFLFVLHSWPWLPSFWQSLAAEILHPSVGCSCLGWNWALVFFLTRPQCLGCSTSGQLGPSAGSQSPWEHGGHHQAIVGIAFGGGPAQPGSLQSSTKWTWPAWNGLYRWFGAKLCLSVGLGWCFTSWDPTFLGHPCQPNFWPSLGHKLYRSAILAVWFWWSKSSSHSQAGALQAVPLKVVLDLAKSMAWLVCKVFWPCFWLVLWPWTWLVVISLCLLHMAPIWFPMAALSELWLSWLFKAVLAWAQLLKYQFRNGMPQWLNSYVCLLQKRTWTCHRGRLVWVKLAANAIKALCVCV